mmetsp:Transcript_1387/g.3063  ORF Transcript_1387/g.3063 Transcript_1387/m.3063 type:complete len:148 (-) Transcript_1387:125-568(-)
MAEAEEAAQELCLRKLLPDEGYQGVMVTAGAQGVDLDSLIGGEAVTMSVNEYKEMLDQMQPEQASVKEMTRDFFTEKFRKLDEGSGFLTAESFKMALSELEGTFSMNFQTELASQLIKQAESSPEPTIDYVKFVSQELLTPREAEQL